MSHLQTPRDTKASSKHPSSFLQCLDRKRLREHQNDEDDDDTASSTPAATIPSLVQPIRMSILGPSQSAKTSLAMDFAYSVVSDSGNVLHNHDDRRGIDVDDDDIAAADCNDEDQGVVLFVIPQCKRALLDFPMRCQRISRTRTKASRRRRRKNQGYFSFQRPDDELHKNMRTSCSYSSSSQEEEEEEEDDLYDAGHSWNQSHKRGLENIQIKYMDSVTDLVYFLASLGKKKKKEYNVCSSSSSSSGGGEGRNSKEDRRRLDAIVIDDLDCYIRSQDNLLNETADEEGQVENGTGQNDDTSATVAATATATTTASIASRVASMTTSLELQKLIQLSIIADTANWMDEMTMMPIETTRDCLGSKNYHSSRKGVHIVTCMNTDRLPLGTSLPQIKAVMSMMQNYTPSIVCIEQIIPMDHPTVVHDEDRQQRVSLESFFHNKKNVGFDKGDTVVKLLSAWKGTLYHDDCKDSLESRFCVAKRCWYEGMEKNFLVNMEESWRNEEEEEDEEEYELFWEL